MIPKKEPDVEFELSMFYFEEMLVFIKKSKKFYEIRLLGDQFLYKNEKSTWEFFSEKDEQLIKSEYKKWISKKILE